MKKILLALTLLAFFGVSDLSAQQEIGGITLPATMSAGDQTLNLNGGGLREKWFLDVYVGGLYMTGTSSDAAAIVSNDEPMAMRIHMVSGLVTSEKMSKATMEGFEKAMNGNIDPLKTKINQFIDNFNKAAIEKGDIFDLIYIPGTGVKVIKNGKDLDVVTGYEFKKALFGIWLGNDPVDDDLKDGMLGK